MIAAGLGSLTMIAGAFADPAQFFRSYLLAYVYWTGIGLGCLALAMIYHLTGGAWGASIRRLLEAGAGTLPFMAILFVPLLFGLGHLYSWTDTSAVLADAVLRQKTAYLNVPFFVARSAVYFLVWLTLGHFLNRWSGEQDRTDDPRVADRLRKLGGGGLVVWGLATTFAAFDWLMSLDPHWFSTIFGMLFMAGQGLGALAFVLVVAYLLSGRESYGRVFVPTVLNDLGNLLLAFVMLWAYLSYSQLLIIWAGNLPEEIPWYLRRISGGWGGVAILLAVFYFAVPFFVLLGRGNKRQMRRLAAVAAGVTLARLVDVYFLIAPEFSASVRVHWVDIAAVAGLGGIFVTLFVWRLGLRPLLPAHDPEVASALARRH